MTGGIAGFAARYPLAWHVIEAEGAGCETLYPAATLRRLSGLPDDSTNRDCEHIAGHAAYGAVVRSPILTAPRTDGFLVPKLLGWAEHMGNVR